MARESLTPSDIGRLLVSQRRKAEQTCPVCGKLFTARVGAIYCSAACRKTAQRQRQRDAKAQQQPDPAAGP